MSNILIVDPDPSTVGFFENAFGDAFGFYMAPNGRRALAQMHKVLPEVAVVEIQLPDMMGWHLVQEMRKVINNLPVIAIATTNDWEDIRQMRIQAYPILSYVLKPFEETEIRKTLLAAVSISQRRSSGMKYKSQIT